MGLGRVWPFGAWRLRYTASAEAGRFEVKILVRKIMTFLNVQVEALAGQRVLQVSCGSRDAQTLALVEGMLLLRSVP